MTLPPTLDSAFMVRLIAATGAPWSPVMVARVRQRLQALTPRTTIDPSNLERTR